jgi:hypothetical protein
MTTTAPAVPPTMRSLPLDKHGRPVPWFVHWRDDAPDHRVMRAEALRDAVRLKLCWTCGKPRGAYLTFVIGPMCGVNRVTAEPPSHRECARYSATACPFLTTPQMTRRPRGVEEGTCAGVSIPRNPGVTLLWTTRSFTLDVLPVAEFGANAGTLFRLGDPTAVEWWRQGRPATRAEVLDSIETGMPILREMAEQDGPRALAQLDRQRAALEPILPAVSP